MFRKVKSLYKLYNCYLVIPKSNRYTIATISMTKIKSLIFCVFYSRKELWWLQRA